MVLFFGFMMTVMTKRPEGGDLGTFYGGDISPLSIFKRVMMLLKHVKFSIEPHIKDHH